MVGAAMFVCRDILVSRRLTRSENGQTGVINSSASGALTIANHLAQGVIIPCWGSYVVGVKLLFGKVVALCDGAACNQEPQHAH